MEGIEVPLDYEKAFQYLSSAANRGASRAVLNLARMYAEGLGIPKNISEAIRLYESLANLEFLAAIALGRIYSRGLGVEADSARASQWYQVAMRQQAGVADCAELLEARAYLENR